MKRAIYDGVLLLDESLPYEVVELPLPRDSPVELLEPESGPPKEPHGRNAAEKREILERLRRYRQKRGLGCFAALAKACGEGVTETTLRNLYHVFSKLVFCLVDTRCVQKYDLSLITGIDGLDPVSGCLRFLGCDGDLLSNEVIHQCGFSHIWSSDDRYKSGFEIFVHNFVPFKILTAAVQLYLCKADFCDPLYPLKFNVTVHSVHSNNLTVDQGFHFHEDIRSSLYLALTAYYTDLFGIKHCFYNICQSTDIFY